MASASSICGAVPPGAVLVLQGDQLAAGADPGVPPGVVEQHQGQHARGLGLAGHELAQDPGQPDGLGAQPPADQVGARAGRVALVEQQVEHGQDPGGPLGQQVRGRHPVGDAGVADLVLGPDQALGHGRLGHQERPGDLGRAQAGQRAQGQRDPGLQRQGRMAAGEDQPQPVVGDAALVVIGGADRILGRRQDQGVPEPGGLGGPAAQPVQGPVARRGGEPGAGLARHAVARPGPQGLRERLLGALLGQVPVAGHADQRRDDPAPLVAEGPGDRLGGVARLDARLVIRHGRTLATPADRARERRGASSGAPERAPGNTVPACPDFPFCAMTISTRTAARCGTASSAPAAAS